MDFLLGWDEAAAGKERLYRALDMAVEHEDAAACTPAGVGATLHADCQIQLYDLSSTYIEGEAEGVEKAKRD